ncbi:MAG: late competence development ComFB family protein [Candidatus Omnitrophota bacterium]|jgi:competence protein ComFB|nr:late competence development ComFB family protein [Candidatus Omnitrophota bacterium]
MAYRNYMEEAVLEELNDVLAQLKDTCKCERCREDMLAYSLNRLPAKYVVTVLGNVYTKLHQLKAQSKADITVQLMEAVKVIKKSPRH